MRADLVRYGETGAIGAIGNPAAAHAHPHLRIHDDGAPGERRLVEHLAGRRVRVGPLRLHHEPKPRLLRRGDRIEQRQAAQFRHAHQHVVEHGGHPPVVFLLLLVARRDRLALLEQMHLLEDAVHHLEGVRDVAHLHRVFAPGGLYDDGAEAQRVAHERLLDTHLLHPAVRRVVAVLREDEEEPVDVDHTVGSDDKDVVGPVQVDQERHDEADRHAAIQHHRRRHIGEPRSLQHRPQDKPAEEDGDR